MPSSPAPAPRPAASPDLALARRILDGDEPAFLRLVDELHATLVRLARGLVPSAAVAEEVAQETWVAVLEGLDRYEGRAGLRTWIARILVNRARTRGAREARSIPFSSFEDAAREGGDAVDPARFDARGHWRTPPGRWGGPTPESLLLDAEARAAVERAVEELPPGQRAVVALRDLADWTSEEVCAALDLSEGNQRVLLHRGRSSVRAALERWFDGEARR